jgi:prepilin-type processing-associated H-X9-DG protein
MYCDANNGKLPESSHTAGFRLSRLWINTLAPYVENVRTVRICPADPRADRLLANNGTSYVFNEYFCVPGPDECLNRERCRATSRSIIMFTGSDTRGTAISEDHTHSRGWFAFPTGAYARALADIAPDRFGGGKPGDPIERRAGGTANYLYLDGHVELLPASGVKAWADQGFNFAKPAE